MHHTSEIVQNEYENDYMHFVSCAEDVARQLCVDTSRVMHACEHAFSSASPFRCAHTCACPCHARDDADAENVYARSVTSNVNHGGVLSSVFLMNMPMHVVKDTSLLRGGSVCSAKELFCMDNARRSSFATTDSAGDADAPSRILQTLPSAFSQLRLLLSDPSRDGKVGVFCPWLLRQFQNALAPEATSAASVSGAESLSRSVGRFRVRDDDESEAEETDDVADAEGGNDETNGLSIVFFTSQHGALRAAKRMVMCYISTRMKSRHNFIHDVLCLTDTGFHCILAHADAASDNDDGTTHAYAFDIGPTTYRLDSQAITQNGAAPPSSPANMTCASFAPSRVAPLHLRTNLPWPYPTSASLVSSERTALRMFSADVSAEHSTTRSYLAFIAYQWIWQRGLCPRNTKYASFHEARHAKRYRALEMLHLYATNTGALLSNRLYNAAARSNKIQNERAQAAQRDKCESEREIRSLLTTHPDAAALVVPVAPMAETVDLCSEIATLFLAHSFQEQQNQFTMEAASVKRKRECSK